MIKDAGDIRNLCQIAVFIVTSVLCVPSTASLAADQPLSPITFPGNITSTTSPSGHYEVRIRRILDQYGEPAYTLSVRDPSHNIRQNILTFDRSVVLKWRPNADGFFLTNYAASNFTDCLVAIPKYSDKNGRMVELRSMIERISRRHQLHIPYNIENSHYYVTCDDWSGDDRILISLSGRRDEDAKEFSYELKYDVARDIVER